MSEGGCMGRCCRCLAGVPCSALMCWLLTTVSVAGCGGALMVASRRTVDLLKKDEYTEGQKEFFRHTDPVCLGVIFGMVVLGLVLLVAATFTSRPLNVTFLGSSRKTNCVKAWLVMEMLLLLVLVVGWIGVCVLIAYPVFVFVIIYTLYLNGDYCIDIKHYVPFTSGHEYCGAPLRFFYENSEKTFECYVIALVAAVIVVLSLVFYLMYTAANFIQIKESPTPTQYSIYKNDGSSGPTKHGSVLDTRM